VAPDPSENPVMTVADVARFLQVEENTVRALARRGELPGKKHGKHWRFLRDELLDSLRPTQATTAARTSSSPALGPVISQEDAAALLGVSVRTVRRMVADGRIERLHTPSGSRRLSRESVMTAAASPG
jgi:excisionase family DNA binding protein